MIEMVAGVVVEAEVATEAVEEVEVDKVSTNLQLNATGAIILVIFSMNVQHGKRRPTMWN